MCTQLDSIISWRGTSVPLFRHNDYFVYLIHFHEKYRHAQHYLGSTGCLDARLARHKSGNGARLMEVIAQHGITWQLARLWHCETLQEAHELERRLKRWSGSAQFCPICKGLPVDTDVFMRQGHQRLEWRDKQARPRRPMPRFQNAPMRGGVL